MAIQRSKVNTMTWVIIVAACAFIDLIQIALDIFFEIGIVVNRFIDIGVGILFILFLTISGEFGSDPQRLTNKVIALFTTEGIEQIPDVDILPLWTADALYNWYLASQRNKQADQEEAAELNMMRADQTREAEIIQAEKIAALRQLYAKEDTEANSDSEKSRSISDYNDRDDDDLPMAA